MKNTNTQELQNAIAKAWKDNDIKLWNELRTQLEHVLANK